MRKQKVLVVSFALILISVLAFSSCTVVNAENKKVQLFGDVNGDEAINIRDVELLLMNALGISNNNLDLSISDMNLDGTINLKDVNILLRCALGIESTEDYEAEKYVKTELADIYAAAFESDYLGQVWDSNSVVELYDAFGRANLKDKKVVKEYFDDKGTAKPRWLNKPETVDEDGNTVCLTVETKLGMETTLEEDIDRGEIILSLRVDTGVKRVDGYPYIPRYILRLQRSGSGWKAVEKLPDDGFGLPAP